jgi:hypothetical protein
MRHQMVGMAVVTLVMAGAGTAAGLAAKPGHVPPRGATTRRRCPPDARLRPPASEACAQ